MLRTRVTVTPMHEKFQLIRSRRQFARLMGLCEAQEKALAEDPKPFLDRAYAEIYSTRHLLEEIKAALSGTDEMMLYSQNAPIELESVGSLALRRVRAAQELIESFEQQSSEPK